KVRAAAATISSRRARYSGVGSVSLGRPRRGGAGCLDFFGMTPLLIAMPQSSVGIPEPEDRPLQGVGNTRRSTGGGPCPGHRRHLFLELDRLRSMPARGTVSDSR